MGKLICAVLRGLEGGNALRLLDRMEKGCESGTSPAAYPTCDIHLLTRYPKQPTVHIFSLSNQPIKRGFNEISVRDVKLSYGMRYVITCLVPYGFCTT